MIYINTHRWPYIGWSAKSLSYKSIGWASLFVSVIAASTGNAFAKVLGLHFSALTLLFVSETLMWLFVVFSFGLMPTVRKLLQSPKSWILPLVVVGLLNSVLAPMLLFTGLQSSTAVNAALFSNSEMVFLMILAVVVMHEKFTHTHALSVLTMTAGLITIALRGFTDGIQLQPGDALIILSGLVFACGSITYRKFLHHCHPHVLLFVRASVAMTCFFVLSPFLNHNLAEEISTLPITVIPVLLGFGFLSRFLNVFSFYEALERISVTTVSLMCNFTAIFSVLFSHWFLGEAIEGFHYLGGALIILGGLMLEFLGTHPTTAHLEAHLRQRVTTKH